MLTPNGLSDNALNFWISLRSPSAPPLLGCASIRGEPKMLRCPQTGTCPANKPVLSHKVRLVSVTMRSQGIHYVCMAFVAAL